MLKNKRTVLLIDDEELLLRSTEASLKILEFKVFSANSGEKAIRILTENPSIDVIVLDKSMPYMNGFETLSSIKEVTENIQIIMSSGYYEENDVRKLKSHGVYACLQKPFSVTKLAEVINNSINSAF